MKKRFHNEIDDQETFRWQKIKTETENLIKVNEIEEHKIRIESIKDTTKIETKEPRVEIRNKLNKIEKKTVIKELRIEIKLNELANNSDIRLIKWSTKSILNIAEYIKNGKIKPIDSIFKNKCTVYCLELPFGIISFCRYVGIETMNIISSDVEMHKVLGNNPSSLFCWCLNN